MTNAKYAPKMEHIHILVKTVVISELIGIKSGDRQLLSTCDRKRVCGECSLFYSYIYISWNSDFFAGKF